MWHDSTVLHNIQHYVCSALELKLEINLFTLLNITHIENALQVGGLFLKPYMRFY